MTITSTPKAAIPELAVVTFPDWTASTEGADRLPPSEVTETSIPGLHEVTLTVAIRPTERVTP